MQEKVYQALCKSTGEPHPALLVAVSGGKDSMALLHAVGFGAKKRGCKVRALHINHGLRQESRLEAMMVQNACRAWKIPLTIVNVDVRAHRKQNESVEMAARRLRYEAFYQNRKEEEWIVTAHHEADVAETVLMHILQGTGLRGLRGIPEKNGRVLRPMLGIEQEEILAYNEKHRIAHCEDTTNSASVFLRNRIRNELIPQLQTQYNPNLISALGRLANYAAEEEAYFEEKVRTLENKAKIGAVKQAGIWYDRKVLAVAEPPILRRWAADRLCALGLRIEHDKIETLCEFCDKPGKTELGGGWLLKSGRWLELYRLPKEHPDIFLEKEGLWEKGHWQMEIYPAEYPEKFPDKRALVQFFDADKIQWPCVLRENRPGDKIQMPFGQKSISDLYTDEKTPMAIRMQFPVLESDGKILWAVGAARSKLANITSETKRMIAMRFTYTLEEENPCLETILNPCW